jgi:heavy-metal-associated domain-containing protein
MDMTVTSKIPGRIRIRDQRLTRADRAEQVRSDLLAMNGVTEVTVGIRTGSLLIIYSTALSSLQGIMEYLTGLFGVTEESDDSCECSFRAADLLAPGAPLRRNAVNYGMLASLLISMVGIMIGLKKLHYAAGVLFLGFFGIHIFERRRAMFA